jgi:hypothetical protein
MPFAMDGRRCALSALLAAALVGCRGGEAPPYPNYAEKPDAPQLSGPNAFDLYVDAAKIAERKAEPYSSRVSFTPGIKAAIIRELTPAMRLVEQAGSRKCAFVFEPAEPFQQQPYRNGWRLIGYAMTWRIEQLVEAERYPEAVQQCLVLTRFGIDLTGGSSADAATGYAFIDQARQALLPAMIKLDSARLSILAAGLQRALDRRPPVAQMLDNDWSNMRYAVQAIQESHQKKTLATFREKLGPDIQPAIKHLEGIAPDSNERAIYFAKLAEEADKTTEYWKGLATMNARQRAAVGELKFTGERPWRRWNRFFFQVSEPIFATRDKTMARTRLLALYASVRAVQKKSGLAPTSLNGYPESLTIDPYSGELFPYRSDGKQFRVYSVGGDFRDDAGETNDNFTEPDLTLESLDL